MLEGAECLNGSTTNKRKKINLSKNDKRRFSDEQIRCLEVMFESETKLEPRKKVEVARELGLQPRQVAIWFQNKRARWKSKYIEKEYAVLLGNYNSLAAQFESLKKEKHSLLTQLQKLKSEMMRGKGHEKENLQWAVEEGGRSSDGESECVKNDFDVKNHDFGRRCAEGMLSVSDDDSNVNAEFCGFNDENDLLKMVEAADWGRSLDSDDIVNQTSCQWWDFWS